MKRIFNSLRKNSLIASITAFNWLLPNRCMNCSAPLTSKLIGDSFNADTDSAETDNANTAIDSHNLQTSPCCDSCYERLPFQDHCCRRCGQTLNATLDYCGRCISNPPSFDDCFCPFRYESPIKDRIQAFKYAGKPEYAKQLAQALVVELLANKITMPDILLPVPIHTSRLRERGYNQSLLLTQQLSKQLRIPYSNKIIIKTRATPAQASLKLKQRKTNIKNSFAQQNTSRAKHIAVIDDVFTTGATAEEIAKILKKGKAETVQIWCLAHTI